VFLGPRNIHAFNTVFGAFHPWHTGDENGFELTGIEVPPTTLFAMIVTRQFEVTLGAAELGPARVFDVDSDLLTLVINLDLSD
jgi:hypothetical protein